MSAIESALPTLADFLAAPLRVGDPDVHGPLAVFPLFGPPPVAEYVAFADGVARGLLVKELEDGASVGDLVVLNPTDANVLRTRARRSSARSRTARSTCPCSSPPAGASACR